MGLLRGVARTAAIAGTASAVSGRVHHRQQQRWAEQEQQAQALAAMQAAQPVAEPAAPSAQDDTVAQLQQLASLRDQGILTDEEFSAKKRQILGI